MHHKVPVNTPRTRLSDYLIGVFPSVPTRKGIKKALKKGRFLLNGQAGYSGDYVSGGESIELLPPTEEQLPKVVELELAVIYEDDYLAVVNKPAGLVVSGNKWMNLTNALPYNLTASEAEDALMRPLAVHRLDYPTSGLVLVGKTAAAVRMLGKLFENKKIRKVYYAVTIGKMADRSGEINKSIAAKNAHSYFEVLATLPSDRFTALNLLRLQPQTGRRHQLRIHLAEMGNPILGDREYGKEGLVLQGKGLYLHAAELKFDHPLRQGTVNVKMAPPNKFIRLFPDQNW